MANDLDQPKNWAAKMHERKSPRIALDWTPDNALKLALNGDWARILKASGNTTVSDGLMGQAAMLGSQGKRIDSDATDFAIGFVDAMEPRDPAEILLLTQMAVVHQATMMMARRLNHAENIRQQDAAERALNKVARTFTTQMETLKRYRSKGHQTVRVERVTVESGGQAVVGNVESGGRGREQS